jgi:5-methyltetrahydrofolate--homocysteine methyltransferase
MTRSTLRKLVQRERILVLDGAWGTELARRGLPAGDAPERWNLTNAARVAEVPGAYCDAGAHVVLTNTFGGSRCKLAKVGLADSVMEVNRYGARISKDAVRDRALVFASVGPTGDFIEPLGALTVAEAEAVFAEQIDALLSGGADAILVETMTDLQETLCAVRAARRVRADVPVVASLTFDKGARGYATMMGITPAHAAEQLAAADVDVVGTNCGNGIENMIEIVRDLRAHCALPLWARPNAGLPHLVNGATVFPDSPAAMAAKVPALRAAGASMIGGCCGTTPAHIRAIADVLRA